MSAIIDVTSPIAELAAAVQSGKTTARALVEVCLAAIKQTSSYHAVLELNAAAIAQAGHLGGGRGTCLCKRSLRAQCHSCY